MNTIKNVITVDVGTVLPTQMYKLIDTVKRATRMMRAYRIEYQTAFVLAYFDIDEYGLRPGFIEAVHNYVWGNDSSRLTKALQRNCDQAMEQMCKVSLTRTKK